MLEFSVSEAENGFVIRHRYSDDERFTTRISASIPDVCTYLRKVLMKAVKKIKRSRR